MKNNAELRNLTVDELNLKLLEHRKTQFKHRMQQVSGTMDKQHKVGFLRKEIARVKTILAEKVGKSHVE